MPTHAARGPERSLSAGGDDEADEGSVLCGYLDGVHGYAPVGDIGDIGDKELYARGWRLGAAQARAVARPTGDGMISRPATFPWTPTTRRR